MSKKNGRKPVTIVLRSVIIAIHRDGSVSEVDTPEYSRVKAGDLDKLFEYAKWRRSVGERQAPKVATSDGDSAEVDEDGDVTVGCKAFTFEELAKIHRASQLARRRRTRK